MAELVIGMKPLKCGHSVLGLDLITWTCWCGEKEPDPPRGLKIRRRSKTRRRFSVNERAVSLSITHGKEISQAVLNTCEVFETAYTESEPSDG